MNIINRHTIAIIAKFLDEYYDEFQQLLGAQGIEESEAEVIIEGLKEFAKDVHTGQVIDRKFEIMAVNPITNKTYDQHNAVLLCAKDKAVPAALHAYQQECMRIGANEEHVRSVGLLIGRVLDYQIAIESRVPDTVGDEIPRCLFGDGI